MSSSVTQIRHDTSFSESRDTPAIAHGDKVAMQLPSYRLVDYSFAISFFFYSTAVGLSCLTMFTRATFSNVFFI